MPQSPSLKPLPEPPTRPKWERIRVPLMFALAFVAMCSFTCAFIYSPPLDESYTAMRFDWPHVHIPFSLGVSVVCVLALGYLALFAGKKRGAK